MRVFLLAAAAVLVAVDQAIKAWAFESLRPVGSMPVIEGVLNWTYVENYGAAFGLFAHRREFLILLTGAIVLIAGILLWQGRFSHPVAQASVLLVVAGGAGNLIDRVTRGFVVDYIDINPLFSYPMFNFADCCVVCGTALIAIYILVLEGRQHHSHEIKEIPPQDSENHREPTEEP